MIYQGLINVIGWLLITSAIIGATTATSGIAYLALRSDSIAISDASSHLHDTYYVVRRRKSAIWPLLLCLTLSSSVGIIGYTHTDRFANRVLEQDFRARQ